MTSAERDLWGRFARTRSAADREALCEMHLPRVGGIVGQIVARKKLRCVSDELLSAGALGLVQAVDSFDPFRGLAFGTWLWIKVRGAVLEECRLSDRWMSRTPRGRHMERETLQDDRSAPDVGPEGLDRDEALWDVLWDVVDPAARRVLKMTFLDHRSTREIAEALGVSESRVSQLRQRALRKLRELYETFNGSAAPGEPVHRGVPVQVRDALDEGNHADVGASLVRGMSDVLGAELPSWIDALFHLEDGLRRRDWGYVLRWFVDRFPDVLARLPGGAQRGRFLDGVLSVYRERRDAKDEVPE